jgi:hypothetical protein
MTARSAASRGSKSIVTQYVAPSFLVFGEPSSIDQTAAGIGSYEATFGGPDTRLVLYLLNAEQSPGGMEKMKTCERRKTVNAHDALRCIQCFRPFITTERDEKKHRHDNSRNALVKKVLTSSRQEPSRY